MTAITTDIKYATNSALVVKSAVGDGGSTSMEEEDDDDDNDDDDDDSRSAEEVVGDGCGPNLVLLILLADEGDAAGDEGGDLLSFVEAPWLWLWLWLSTSIERSLCDRDRTLESLPPTLESLPPPPWLLPMSPFEHGDRIMISAPMDNNT